MAQLQNGSTCTRGIYVNSTQTYTMVRLPSGNSGTGGFNKAGDLWFDTTDRNINFYNSSTQRYRINMTEFINL